jgi:ammonium transporter, Amt family
VNPAGADGLLEGNTSFFLKQSVAVIVASIWAFAFTWGMLWAINKVSRVKVDESEEEQGLDSSLHGERAYDMEERHAV